jgi:hypothetical protein
MPYIIKRMPIAASAFFMQKFCHSPDFSYFCIVYEITKKDMKKIITKTMLVAVAAMAFASCGNGSFKIEGVITEAQDSVLYLENMALDGPQKVDSVKLSADGTFSFSCEAPTESPEFYRLRIAQQIINFSVDSIETCSVKASYPTMMSDYEIEGGKSNNIIKELDYMQKHLAEYKEALESNDSERLWKLLHDGKIAKEEVDGI